MTMPNKVAIMEHLDEATEECREVGACNTIFVRERDRDRDRDRYDGGQPQRIYCGANTDVIGVREAFYQNVADPDAVFHDRPAMVVGGGGAARSAVYALRKWMRATKIYLVNRDGAEVRAVMADCTARGYGGDALVHLETVDQAAQAEVLPGAIVACVPDLPPNTEGERTARAIVETVLRKDRNGCMLEMCYNPSPWSQYTVPVLSWLSELVRLETRLTFSTIAELGGIAEQEGWQVILGTEAMVWQGLEQDRYWTGMETKTLPVQKVRDVISEKLASIRETL